MKLGADNLKGVKNEELLVANHKYVVNFFFPTWCVLFLVLESKILIPKNMVMKEALEVLWIILLSKEDYGGCAFHKIFLACRITIKQF